MTGPTPMAHTQHNRKNPESDRRGNASVIAANLKRITGQDWDVKKQAATRNLGYAVRLLMRLSTRNVLAPMVATTIVIRV